MLITKGIHHITAMTSDAEKIYQLMTEGLGLRLTKKTVNQDDINTYHLFFTDAIGSPGTDLTFFDFPNSKKRTTGKNSIQTIGLRVPSNEALGYFKTRFENMNIFHESIQSLFDMTVLPFQDFDGQHYMLVSDEGIAHKDITQPWHETDIPKEFRILGLGPIEFIVHDLEVMTRIMEDSMHFKQTQKQEHIALFETHQGGNSARVIVRENSSLPPAILGYGGVHHVAFRVDDDAELHQWIQFLNQMSVRHSGYVDRFYFHSLYTRLHQGILFEFATDGPGFEDDEEDLETLGTTLALPPKLRPFRNQIETQIKPIDTRKKS
jgi:glyoxalase family protein